MSIDRRLRQTAPEEVTIDGVRYVPVDEEERRELGERIATFTLEGSTFWKRRFEADSAPGQWNAGMYGGYEEESPFFTEAFLYNLLGKDEARSVLGIIRRLSALAGVEYR
jgi:hypothetical protein